MSVSKQDLHIRKPEWLKTKIPTGSTLFKIRSDLRQKNLYTVCEEARCPNIEKCWNSNTATFMILGDTCTRACRFCNVKTGNPQGWLDPHEPAKVAESVQTMALSYVVLTMVDRDDLPDGGSHHVAEVMKEIRRVNPGIKIEILGGDFNEVEASLQHIVDVRPEVFAHNLETVKRLTPRVRDARASYDKSLRVLAKFKELGRDEIFTKSALMLGLGETLDEVGETLRDMRQHGVDFITVGQYMRPTKKHLSIKRWVTPQEFKDIEILAYELGFKGVASSPLVRSSYMAREFYEEAMQRLTITEG